MNRGEERIPVQCTLHNLGHCMDHPATARGERWGMWVSKASQDVDVVVGAGKNPLLMTMSFFFFPNMLVSGIQIQPKGRNWP